MTDDRPSNPNLHAIYFTATELRVLAHILASVSMGLPVDTYPAESFLQQPLNIAAANAVTAESLLTVLYGGKVRGPEVEEV